MIVYAMIAAVLIGIFLMLLKWSLKTLLPRRAGVVIDKVYATGEAIVNKAMALVFLMFLAFIGYIVLFGLPQP